MGHLTCLILCIKMSGRRGPAALTGWRFDWRFKINCSSCQLRGVAFDVDHTKDSSPLLCLEIMILVSPLLIHRASTCSPLESRSLRPMSHPCMRRRPILNKLNWPPVRCAMSVIVRVRCHSRESSVKIQDGGGGNSVGRVYSYNVYCSSSTYSIETTTLLRLLYVQYRHYRHDRDNIQRVSQ